MSKIHTWQNNRRPILFAGPNLFARLDRFHSMTDCFLFNSPTLACQNTDVFSDVFPMDRILNLPLILTPPDKDLLRTWRAKWVDTSSCSICNSADEIFYNFFLQSAETKKLLEVLFNLPRANKKNTVFQIFKHETPPPVKLLGSRQSRKYHNYWLETVYHMEPVWKRTESVYLTLWDRNKPLLYEGPMLLRENQQEMGHLIARDSSSAFFRKKRNSGPPLHYSSVI